MGPRNHRIPKENDSVEEGQALAEYTLILVFVALACVAAVTLFGGTVQGLYNGFNGSF